LAENTTPAFGVASEPLLAPGLLARAVRLDPAATHKATETNPCGSSGWCGAILDGLGSWPELRGLGPAE